MCKRNAGLIFTFVALFCWCEAASAEQAKTISLPDSEKSYTEAQINDFFNVPDWYPDSHPPMPAVVQFGAKPAVFACASCHLTSGSGHPESAFLSGLPADYFYAQMKAYQRAERDSITGVMNSIAGAMTDQQIRDAAEYFQALPGLNVQQVVETDDVPVTYVNSRFMRLIDKNQAATEPIGQRIITVPTDEVRVKARDPYSTFSTFVPEGYLAAGKRIVEGGRNGTVGCIVCHGADLKGTPAAPPVAGQHASYLVAQLRAYKEGTRRGGADPGGIMANNVKYFTDREILATAAYIASLSRE